MDIAIIGSAHPFRGGLAAYNERLAKALMEQGHTVTIYTFTLQYPGFLFPGKTQYSEEPKPDGLTIKRCINSINPFNWLKVGRHIRKSKPDLLIIKYWLPFMGPCFGTILRRVKKNRHTRIVAIIDNIIPHESRPGDRAFSRYFVKPVDGFIAMSQNVLHDLDRFITDQPKILSPHPLFDNFGAPESQDSVLDKLGWDKNCKYILFFGLIRDYKGLDLLLEAFAHDDIRNLNVKLVIAGEYYTDRAKYDDLIRRNNLSGRIIQIDRFIQDSEVATYFSAADLVVQPYKSATQSGVTQIAYHFNKPMVVTNVGGLPEMCPDGKVGYICKPEADDLVRAIKKFFTETDVPAMIAQIKTEKKKYSWEILTENIFKLK